MYKPNNGFLYENNRVGNIVIDETADIHPNAYFEGNVTIGPYCQIDAGVVIIGDIKIGGYTVIRCNATLNGTITVGSNCHIFDTASIRGGTPDKPVIGLSYKDSKTVIEDNCIIYHGAVIINSTVSEGSVIGMKAGLGHGSYIGKHTIIANRTMTPPKSLIPDNAFAQGVPMQIKDTTLTDAKRADCLGFIPMAWITTMSAKLEQMYKNNIRLADRNKNTKIKIGKNTFVHPTAILEGDITIGDNCRVGPGNILVGNIKIGSYLNLCVNNVLKGNITLGNSVHIYDNCVVDSSSGPDVDVIIPKEESTVIEDYGWVNHGCMLRGSNVSDSFAMGVNSCADYGTVAERKVLISAGTVTPRSARLSKRAFIHGVPGEILNYGTTDQDRQNYLGLIPEIWLDVIKPGYDEPFSNKPEENHVASTVKVGKYAYIHPKAWVEGGGEIGDYFYMDAGSIIVEGAKHIGDYVVVGCNCALRGNMTFNDFTYFFDQINLEGGRAGGCIGTNTSEVPDPSIFGIGAIICSGAVMHGTRLGNDGIMGIGSAGDYNAQMLWGVILSSGSTCLVSQYVLPDTKIEGIPSAFKKFNLRDEDRMEALGIHKDEFVLKDIKLRKAIAVTKGD